MCARTYRRFATTKRLYRIFIIGRKLFIINGLRPILPLGLGRDHGVLGGLRKPELHGRLGLDLDGFTCGRVSAHAGRTLRLHQLAQPWNRELAVLRGFGPSRSR